MSSQTIYIKIDKNVLVHNRNITLGDIAKIECTDVGMLRKIRQKKVYPFQGKKKKKNQFQVFSILKIIQLIHEDYPNADVQNEGEADFIVEYVPRLNPPMGVAYLKTILLCIVIFFGSPFTIMAFNNDVGRKKITPDPTPLQVEMRKYENDIDTTFIENSSRGGSNIDVG